MSLLSHPLGTNIDRPCHSPLFVTWNTRPSRPGRSPRLRGCIGNFDPMPIRDGLAEYALISAFRDSRFRKIDKTELETLECGYVLHSLSFHGLPPFLCSRMVSVFLERNRLDNLILTLVPFFPAPLATTHIHTCTHPLLCVSTQIQSVSAYQF